MTHPVYAGSQVPGSLSRDAHAGLWWDKFFNGYTLAWVVGDAGKSDWIRTVTGKRGSTSLVKGFAQRQYELGRHLNAEQKVFKTNWHFVTGLGLSHPVENGFAWHPTLGVPYLPGSGVKGLLRGWVEEWQFEEGEEAERDAKIRLWFGGVHDAADAETDNEVDEAAGGLIFFDAIPIEAVTLALDTATPQRGKWYEQGGQIDGTPADATRLPADWHSSVPIPFLVVQQASFLFQIAPRGRTPSHEVNQAMEQLQFALDYLGAGAKTAAGYGHMSEDDKSLQRLQAEQQKLDAKSGKSSSGKSLKHAGEAAVSEPDPPVGQVAETLEIVILENEFAAGVRVQVDTGEIVECSGITNREAQEKWQAGVREFFALVSRRSGVAIRAIWKEW